MCVVGDGTIHYEWEEFDTVLRALHLDSEAQETISLCL